MKGARYYLRGAGAERSALRIASRSDANSGKPMNAEGSGAPRSRNVLEMNLLARNAGALKELMTVVRGLIQEFEYHETRSRYT